MPASDPPSVRPAVRGDGAGCAAVWVEAGQYYHGLDPSAFRIPDTDGLAASFERDIGEAGPDELRLVADARGAVAGFLVATLRRPGPWPGHEMVRDLTAIRFFVDVLVVGERHRRSGVGTALLTAAERWARGHGATVVVLDTYVDSPLSVPFYERRMGYARRAVIFRKELGPEY